MQIVTTAMFNKKPCFFRHLAGSFPAGKLSSAHSHQHCEIVYVVSGNVALWVEDRKYTLLPGDLYLIQPSRYHYLEILTPSSYDRYVLHFLHDEICTLDLPEDTEVVSLPSNSVAAGLFPRLDYYRNRMDDETFDALLPLLINELIYNLKFCSAPSLQKVPSGSPILTKALDYINDNLFSITGVEEVAQELFISSNYLFYLFRTTLHCSPKRYITEKRLWAAQRFIREGHKLSTVYMDCGFKDYSTFYRSYCSFFGRAPSQDRTS